jgi:predicted lipoprotein with Yx(FWY)xxD motif
MTASVGSNGTLVVAGSNSMTVYVFSKDTADSGTSACTAACITKWPALTVPAGTTPTGGSGATGKVGTITRSDSNRALQVTYNGLPLYFFSGDKAVGDSNGIYPGWSGVKP